MQTFHWQPPIELSEQEEQIVKRRRRAKLLVDLASPSARTCSLGRSNRNWRACTGKVERGQPPWAPAQLALATIVQANTGSQMMSSLRQLRWIVGGSWCLTVWTSSRLHSSLGTLVAFRRRPIDGQMDRRLIERTLESANQSQACGSRPLRAALDCSPLWGTGRVEDIYNLMGHARKPGHTGSGRSCLGGSWSRVAKEAGTELVCGTSLKAALDRDWDQQLRDATKPRHWFCRCCPRCKPGLETLADDEEKAEVQQIVEIAQQVQEQDVEIDEKGKASLIKGGAFDRRISVEDGQMCHGRKSRSVRVDGDTRHVLHDLDTGLIRAVGLTPAHVPEASMTETISVDLERQEVSLNELHIDRAYLSSHVVADA